jgi:hypothetical protein
LPQECSHAAAPACSQGYGHFGTVSLSGIPTLDAPSFFRQPLSRNHAVDQVDLKQPVEPIELASPARNTFGYSSVRCISTSCLISQFPTAWFRLSEAGVQSASGASVRNTVAKPSIPSAPKKGWPTPRSFRHKYPFPENGRLAQLVRAPVSHTGGRRFEPSSAHQASSRTE